MFWIREIFLKNSLLSFLLIFCSLFLLFGYYFKKSLYVVIFLLSFAVLVFFQLKTTDYKYGYKPLPAEIDTQAKRMNLFPPKLARLAYYLEFKKETLLVNKLQNNFFDILDFKLYFGNYFSYFSIPFFFSGLFHFFKNKRGILHFLFLGTIVFLSFLGKNGRFGPFLIFPFFILFISIGLLKIFNVFRK